MSEDNDEVALSASRRKTKWSLDPRNTFWSSDKSRFGFRMLEQMGWAEGKGLGVNEDGVKNHVKISKKTDCAGVGAGKSFGDEWIGHQDTFESLLADLNNSNTDEKDENIAKDLTSAAKKTRKLTYQKSLKSKDIFHKSNEDLNCVLGRRRKREHDSAINGGDSDEGDNTTLRPSEPVSNVTGITTIKSDLDVTNYFAQKEKKRKKEVKGKSKKQKKSKRDEVKTKRTKST